MSEYSDFYNDERDRALIDKWCPASHGIPPLTEHNMRLQVARTLEAEDELRKLKAALGTIHQAVKT